MSTRKNASKRKSVTDRTSQTQEYLAKASLAWRNLLIGNIEIPLSELYKPLNAVTKELSPLESRTDLMTDLGNSKPEKTLSIGKILNQSKRIVLLGAPGAGKSTTLQYIGYCFSTPGISDVKLGIKEDRVPLLLSLKIYEDILSVSGTLLENVLAKEVSQRLRVEFDVADKVLIDWRDTGKLLILLDGLDEVSETNRSIIQKEIQAFSAANIESSIILSSRAAGYSSIGSDFKEFILLPLDDEEEITQYLQTWLAVFYSWKPNNTLDMKSEAETLYREIRFHPALEKILHNPLILRLAAEEYARTGKVASNRLALYQNWIENAWERAEQRGALSAQKQGALKQLEELAWCLQNKLELPSYEVDLLCEKFGLVARVGNQVIFVHQTLQEYMVSKTLLRAKTENPSGFWIFIRARLHLPSWRESLLLLVPQLPPKEAEEFIVQVSKTKSQFEKDLERDAKLTILLAGELESYSRAILLILIKLLKSTRENFKHSHEHTTLFHILRKHGHLVSKELTLLLYHKNPEIAETSANVLGRMDDKRGIEILTSLMNHKKAKVRAAVAYGLSSDYRSRPYLKMMINDKDEKVRKTAFPQLYIGSDYLNDLPRDEALKALSNKELNIRRYGVRSLGAIHNPGDLEVLSNLVFDKENKEILDDIADALGNFDQLNDHAIWALFVIIVSDPFMANLAAKRALPAALHPRAIELIVNFMKNNQITREVGIAALGKFESILALDILVDALDDKDSGIRRAAAESLGDLKFKDDRLVKRLLVSLHDASPDVQTRVAFTLGDLEVHESRDHLINLLHKSDVEKVRRACIWGLKMIYTPKPYYKEGPTDNRSPEYVDDKKYLDVKPVIAALVKSLNDASHEIQREAANALGEIKSLDAVEPLLIALNTNGKGIKPEIISALGELGDTRPITYLLPLLEDENFKVRLAAAAVFTKIPSSEASELLLKILRKDGNAQYGFAKDNVIKAIIECQKMVDPAQRSTSENQKQLREIITTAKRLKTPELLNFAKSELEVINLKYFDPMTYRPPRHKANVLLKIVVLFFWMVVGAFTVVISNIGGNILSTAPGLNPVVIFVWKYPVSVFIFLIMVSVIGSIVLYFQTQKENDLREESR